MKKDTTIEVRGYILKSEALFNSGNLTEARVLAKKAIEMEPGNSTAHSDLGAIYHQLGDMKNAVFHSGKAAKLQYANKQYNKPTLMNLAHSLIGAGKLREAVSTLQGCQSTGDPDFTNLLNQALSLQQHKFANGLLDILQKIRPPQVVIGIMHSYRLGHACLNTELLLRLIQLGKLPKDNKYILISPEDPANQQLVDMYKRHISIVENSELFGHVLNFTPLLQNSEHWINTFSLYDGSQYEEFNSTDKTISFTDEEEQKGNLGLKKLGIKSKDWFVCIFARDSEYMNVHTPNADWSYHDYRDMDVNTYHKAIDFIISKGGYVVRMGHITNQKLNYHHKKVIHYGGSDLRSDFMDVYLSAKCRFFIGSPSGACEIAASSFEVPVLTVNIAPVGNKPLSKNALYIPQKIRKTDSNSYVSIAQFINDFTNPFDDSLLDGKKFKDMGYVHERNTEDEILDATIEMYERVTTEYRPEVADQELLNSYFEIYPENHLCRKNKTPIALSFLKRHHNLFFE